MYDRLVVTIIVYLCFTHSPGVITFVNVRTYCIRIPGWMKLIYPSATWSVKYEEGIQWTIDDGPHPVSTLAWLKLLDEHSIKAHFFLLGERAEKFPGLVSDIKCSGHQIGSHGYSHLDGWKTPFKEYVSGVQRSLDILETTQFRPPYGRISWRQYTFLKNKCDIFMWNFMPGDFDNRVTAEILDNRLSRLKQGDLVVLHDRPDCIRKVRLCAHRFRHRCDKTKDKRVLTSHK